MLRREGPGEPRRSCEGLTQAGREERQLSPDLLSLVFLLELWVGFKPQAV